MHMLSGVDNTCVALIVVSTPEDEPSVELAKQPADKIDALATPRATGFSGVPLPRLPGVLPGLCLPGEGSAVPIPGWVWATTTQLSLFEEDLFATDPRTEAETATLDPAELEATAPRDEAPPSSRIL